MSDMKRSFSLRFHLWSAHRLWLKMLCCQYFSTLKSWSLLWGCLGLLKQQSYRKVKNTQLHTCAT